jgi:hypothetical protein
MSSQPSSVRVREFCFLFWGVCVFLHFETLSIDRIKDKRVERKKERKKRKEEKHFPRVRFVIMSADMGREKKMKNNFKRKEKRKKKETAVDCMSGAPVTTRCALLPSSSQCVRCCFLPANCRLRDYTAGGSAFLCVALETFPTYGRSPESHTNPVLLLQRHRQLKINGQLYKCM